MHIESAASRRTTLICPSSPLRIPVNTHRFGPVDGQYFSLIHQRVLWRCLSCAHGQKGFQILLSTPSKTALLTARPRETSPPRSCAVSLASSSPILTGLGLLF